MIFRFIDEGVVESGMGLFLICRPLAEDSAINLKRGQLNVYIVYGVLLSYLRTVKSGAYDMV
jgi:hypothetical protein